VPWSSSRTYPYPPSAETRRDSRQARRQKLTVWSRCQRQLERACARGRCAIVALPWSMVVEKYHDGQENIHRRDNCRTVGWTGGSSTPTPRCLPGAHPAIPVDSSHTRFPLRTLAPRLKPPGAPPTQQPGTAACCSAARRGRRRRRCPGMPPTASKKPNVWPRRSGQRERDTSSIRTQATAVHSPPYV
jgi:hypothetical protein